MLALLPLNQGWFHGYTYKGNQGVRVRRGTIVGILLIGMFGIVTLWLHHWFGADKEGVPNNWTWETPYSSTYGYVPLMYKVHVVMPILLSCLLVWFAWRTVNIASFADFLIATEAEMNKVSWTSRRKLQQDTGVVLVTVLLFTSFLFIVDVAWIKILSAPLIRVLFIDTRAEAQKQDSNAQW